MRDILEAALRAEPDDRALSAAYADFLLEEGDPRGELIRLQLLAEDPTLSADERAAFDLELEDLFRVHADRWLDGLADLLLRGHGQEWRPAQAHRRAIGADWWFDRGWLAGIDRISLDARGVRFLADSPATAMLRDLGIDELTPVRGAHQIDTTPLNDSPKLANLRRFRLGTAGRLANYGYQLLPWVRAMRRIGELELNAELLPTASLFALPSLHRLTELTVATTGLVAVSALASNPTTTRLRRLALTAVGEHRVSIARPQGPEWEPPEGLPREEVASLFADEALPALTHLRLGGSTLGDRGVEAMLKARLVKRLTELELTDGCLTDAAADMLAAHRDTTKVTVLNLSRNAISHRALVRLRAALPESVTLIADGQRSADAHVGSSWPDRRASRRRSGRPRR
jgi:uncharacterized protein (TIGR02996 family)